jgi:hypothetical protein
MNTLGAALILGLRYLGPVVAGAGEAKRLNPYTGQAEPIREGEALYDRYSRAACHGTEGGGGDGGGQGPPVLDEAWVFGSDDDTPFKLIRGELPGQTMPAAPAKPCSTRRSGRCVPTSALLPGGPQQDHLVGL